MNDNLLVTATCRLDFPSSITSNTSSGLLTNLSVAPFTKTTLSLSSCTARLTFDAERQFFNGLTNKYIFELTIEQISDFVKIDLKI